MKRSSMPQTPFRGFIALALVALASMSAAGQSVFTQHVNAPVTTNPAGILLYGDALATVHYRKTNLSAGPGYVTPMVSWLQPLRYGKGTQFGAVSLSVFQERAGANGIYSNTGVTGGFAYRIPIDKNNVIGAGIQVAYLNNKVDAARVITDSQYGENGYDPALPTGENFTALAQHTMRYNAGVTWFTLRKVRREVKTKSWLGVASYSMNRPTRSFTDVDYREPLTWIASGGFTTEARGAMSYTPSFRVIYTWQELLAQVGSLATYAAGKKGEENLLHGGLYYNNNNFISILGAWEKDRLYVSASYDYYLVNTEGVAINNAVELFVAYKLKAKTNKR